MASTHPVESKGCVGSTFIHLTQAYWTLQSRLPLLRILANLGISQRGEVSQKLEYKVEPTHPLLSTGWVDAIPMSLSSLIGARTSLTSHRLSGNVHNVHSSSIGTLWLWAYTLLYRPPSMSLAQGH